MKRQAPSDGAVISGVVPVLVIFVTMVFIVAVALAVMVYVAFPRRGEEVPHASWVGDALRTSVHALPTLEHQRTRETVDH
jgi:hypothetical protein